MARLDTNQVPAQRVQVIQTRTPDDSDQVLVPGTVRAALLEIGAALDERRPLRMFDGGIVALDRSSIFLPERMETYDERQRARGPSTGSRQGSSRREGSTGRSRAAGAPARVSREYLWAAYDNQLMDVRSAYPTLRTFPDADGMWLLVESAILKGLPRGATFLVGIPYVPGLDPKAWGFWHDDRDHRWIGPRHTNFGDGSICAFSPNDGVWSQGGDLTSLLDLYSVWAARHLILEVSGRWPGRQYALVGADVRVEAFYRLRECRDDELCGCGSETATYAQCCKPRDSKYDFAQMANAFLREVPGGFASRRAPDAVTEFVLGGSRSPRLRDVHLQMRRHQGSGEAV